MPISINNTTLTFNNGTTMTTAATGTVSSVATGNGLSGGTITTTGTLTVACPSYNSVGSYALYGKLFNGANAGPNAGQDLSTVGAAGIRWYGVAICDCPVNQGLGGFTGYDNLSGTWRHMGGRVKSNGGNNNNYVYAGGVACRVA